MPGLMPIAAAPGSVGLALRSALARVEARFREELASPIRPVSDLCEHVERYRGKMLRPTLVFLSGMAVDPGAAEAGEDLVVCATVLEMIHMATLVHDDVLDEASIRRGGDTVNVRAGNEAAIILGDYLLSKSYHLCSTLDSQATARRVGEVTSIVCEGEMLQLAHRGDVALPEAVYFDIIRRKTGALIALACELGARHAGADARTIERLARFGDGIGTAFQIQDDLLDLTGDEPVVGKSLGRDLEKGTLTLPIIHHLSRLPTGERAAAVQRLRAGDRGGLARGLERTGSIDAARRLARERVEDAKSLLSTIEDSPARAALLSLADAVITRAF
jgi:octaprenyl-diphosphate synthase